MAVLLVPKETVDGETRVACVPETARGLVKAGIDVRIERGAGAAAGFPDAEFEEAGAKLIDNAANEIGNADVVLGIRPPAESAVSSFKRGAVLISSLQPLLNLELVKKLADQGVTTFAMDLMPRVTRAQKMDILSSQATVAGYQAVLMAAASLPRFFPLLMTAAGTIRPAKVLILGAGVAGLQAIAMARRLGAVVEANDIRPAVKEQVESLGAKFVDTGTPPQAETTGGYAKETGEEFLRKQREILTEHLKTSDVLITTALIPGKKAPVLVTEDMVKAMRPGSVAVDLAVEMGGNIEGSEPGKHVQKHGITIIGEANLPGLVPADASRMFARNIVGFMELVLDGDKVEPKWDDEIVKGCLVTKEGKVEHQQSAEALGQTTSAEGAS